ncbi:MAG TPA: OmcA/MtrC family decaheme c-type cytochrome [Nitrospirota bacterium]|nr:OmcA/MtrC family decaheme c-type cytochrome [Nitrospirota bacterium]
MGKQLKCLVACILIMAGTVAVSGCGSSKKEGAEAPVQTLSPTGNIQVRITGATVSAATGTLVVSFTMRDEKGAPLDPTDTSINGKSFVVSQLDQDGEYHNPIRNASNQPAADTGGTFAGSGGSYTYTFGKNITLLPGYDPTLTYTVAAYIGRTIANAVGSPFRQIANPRFDFRPNGTTVTDHRQIVSIDACNECHGKLAAHEGNRIDVALCILCHNPGEIDANTGNTIEFKGLIHKIHMGGKLPSNMNGGAYGIIGFNNAQQNFSTVVFPQMSGDTQTDNTPVTCIKCHRTGTDTNGQPYGLDADSWRSTPEIDVCITCHDLTYFDNTVTSLTFTTYNGTVVTLMTPTIKLHSGGPQPLDSSTCGNCHSSASNLDYSSLSVPDVHAIPIRSTLNTGFTINILTVTNVGSGLTPSVTFTMKDRNGSNVDLSSATSGTNFVDIVMGYMTGPDYDNSNPSWIAGQSYVQGVRARVNDKAAHAATANADGSYTVDFGTTWSPLTPAAALTLPSSGVVTLAAYGGMKIPIPATFTQHRVTAGTSNVTLTSRSVAFATFDIATGLSATPAQQRRRVVSTDNCNVCHLQLAFHGRRTDTQLCVICHSPNLYSTTAPGTSGDLKDFLHGIHGTTPAISSSPFTTVFRGTERAEFPNDPRRCNICHVNNSQLLPLETGVRGSLKSGATTTSLDGARVLPIKAACIACHDDAVVSAHADSKVVSGVETCAACHGTGLLNGVDEVHQPAF